MVKHRKRIKQPKRNPVVDRILIPTSRPEITESVAKAVMTHTMVTYRAERFDNFRIN